MSLTRLLAGFVCALAAVSGLAPAEPPAPPGCHWQPIPELKANLAVPDGWVYRASAVGAESVYEVIPSGAPFEVPSRSRFEMRVKRRLEPSQVLALARKHVEDARAKGLSAEPVEVQEQGVVTLFASRVRMAPDPGSENWSVVAVAALSNSRTGTLYTIHFGIPAAELDRVAALGNELFRNIRIDDEP